MPRANLQKQHHRTGDRVNGNAFKLVFLTKERYTFHCNIHILPYLNQFHRLYNKICMDNVQKQKINKTKERNQLHRIYCCFQKRRTPNKSFQLQWKERKTAAFWDHFWNLNFELDTISLKKKRHRFCARRSKSTVKCDATVKDIHLVHVKKVAQWEI